MAELRALCAGCRKPLSGLLLASKCNHVFHKRCLESTEACGRCHAPVSAENALSLFNLTFEDRGDADTSAVMSAAARLQAESEQRQLRRGAPSRDDESIDMSDSEDLEIIGEDREPQAQTEEDVAKLCLLREKLRGKRQAIEMQSGQLCEKRERRDHQNVKLYAALQKAERKKADIEKTKQEIAACVEDREKKESNLNQVRLRDAVAEYWEEVRFGNSDVALNMLLTNVGLVPNPARVMAQIARLRDHHRRILADCEQQSGRADHSQKKIRRDIAELEQKKKALNADLARRTLSDSGG
mmetsp:Transcript_1805/g.3238  ORF Transcript_1805/g.3238 Transcript_1805/m.3238 type:complete len:298 (+) Transcript_1805:39-932(+)